MATLMPAEKTKQGGASMSYWAYPILSQLALIELAKSHSSRSSGQIDSSLEIQVVESLMTCWQLRLRPGENPSCSHTPFHLWKLSIFRRDYFHNVLCTHYTFFCKILSSVADKRKCPADCKETKAFFAKVRHFSFRANALLEIGLHFGEFLEIVDASGEHRTIAITITNCHSRLFLPPLSGKKIMLLLVDRASPSELHHIFKLAN